jgi:putative Holliday junction resolvase
MIILGIDYGTKKVGIALSDDGEMIAFPKKVIPHTKELLKDIKEIVKANSVGAIVVGESKDLSGAENPLMEDIRSFVATLTKEVRLPVHLEPEFLTSHEARRGGTREDMIDASAAALILQRFLEKRANKR